MIYYSIKHNQLVIVRVLAEVGDTADWLELPRNLPGFTFVGYL